MLIIWKKGTDYPRPIVNHEVVMKENLEKMKKAYQRNEPSM